MSERFVKTVRSHVHYPPIGLNISVTSRCNFSCVECYRRFLKTVHNVDMDLSTFKSVVDQLPYLFNVNVVGVGEPFLNPDFLEMLRYLRKRMFPPRVYLATNGSLLDKETIKELVCGPFKRPMVHKLSISTDGIGKDGEAIRKGSNQEQLILLLQRIREAKRKYKSRYPVLESNFVMMRSNIQCLPHYIEYVKRLGFQTIYTLHPLILSEDFLKEHLHACNEDWVSGCLKTSKFYADSIKMDIRWCSQNPSPTMCLEPWYRVVVNELGQFKPCSFVGALSSDFTEYYDGTSQEVFQEDFDMNIDGQDAGKVWKNKRYESLRRMLLKVRKSDKTFERQRFILNRQESYRQLRRESIGRGEPYCAVCQFRFQTAC